MTELILGSIEVFHKENVKKVHNKFKKSVCNKYNSIHFFNEIDCNKLFFLIRGYNAYLNDIKQYIDYVSNIEIKYPHRISLNLYQGGLELFYKTDYKGKK